MRLMTQQNWPFENRICGVTSDRDMNEADDDEEEGEETDESEDEAEKTTVFIVEGGQICYGSKRAWDNCRDC